MEWVWCISVLNYKLSSDIYVMQFVVLVWDLDFCCRYITHGLHKFGYTQLEQKADEPSIIHHWYPVHLLSSHQQVCTRLDPGTGEGKYQTCFIAFAAKLPACQWQRPKWWSSYSILCPKEAEATLWFVDYTEELPLWKGQHFHWPELTYISMTDLSVFYKGFQTSSTQGISGVWLIHRKSYLTAC